MSAPQTDIETEVRWHWPSLLGIVLSMLVGALIGAAITFTAVSRGQAPQGAPVMIDGRTGEAQPSGPASAGAPAVAPEGGY